MILKFESRIEEISSTISQKNLDKTIVFSSQTETDPFYVKNVSNLTFEVNVDNKDSLIVDVSNYVQDINDVKFLQAKCLTIATETNQSKPVQFKIENETSEILKTSFFIISPSSIETTQLKFSTFQLPTGLKANFEIVLGL